MLSLINNKKWKLICFFLDNPTERIHLRALSRRLEISPSWIKNNLSELEKKELIIVEKNKDSPVLYLKANRESFPFQRLKISFNLYRIFESGLLTELISIYNKPEAIVLFGSYCRGEDIEESDIDLAVINCPEKKFNLKPLEKKLNRTIKILLLDSTKIEPEFRNTLANGIILYGYFAFRK